jgi:hypothetical protein
MINRDRLAINTHLRSLADGSMRARILECKCGAHAGLEEKFSTPL